MKKIAKFTVGFMIGLMVFFPIGYYLAINAPADGTFNRKFQAHETMAHDSATFDKMEEQIFIIWQNMNKTWNPDSFNEVFNTWWYPDQTYENSLAATNDYFSGLVSRIDATIAEMEQIQSGNKTILQPYNAYYQSQLDAFRNETFDAGGLLWAIRGAWYLQFAPLAYWSLTIWVVLWVVGAVVIPCYLIFGGDAD